MIQVFLALIFATIIFGAIFAAVNLFGLWGIMFFLIAAACVSGAIQGMR